MGEEKVQIFVVYFFLSVKMTGAENIEENVKTFISFGDGSPDVGDYGPPKLCTQLFKDIL